MRRTLGALVSGLLTLTLLTALPQSPAQGAVEKFEIGTGTQVALAIDSGGTAYVVWNGTETVGQRLTLCKFRRGATGCEFSRTLPVVGSTTRRPFVVVEGLKVAVYSARYGDDVPDYSAIYRWLSTDGGQTWARSVVGYGDYARASNGPGDSVSFVTDQMSQSTMYRQVARFSPHAEVSTFLDTEATDTQVTTPLLQQPLVTYADSTGRHYVRQYSGSGSIGSESSWKARREIGITTQPTQLVSAFSGTFLLFTSGTATRLRPWDGSTFGTGVTVPGLPVTTKRDATLSNSEVIVAWLSTAATPRLELARTEDGITFSRQTLPALPGAVAADGLRLAVAPDRHGFLAWETGGTARSIYITRILGPEPDTVILEGPPEGTTVHDPARFVFGSHPEGLTFECSLQTQAEDDEFGALWKACTSPVTQEYPIQGAWVFRVRAVRNGVVDPTPAVRTYHFAKRVMGNFRIRGIDVFQLVQPTSNARLGGYDPANPAAPVPFPNYCGGGTPTGWLFPCTDAPATRYAWYEGVTLDSSKPATVAIHIDLDSNLRWNEIRRYEVTLTARRVDGHVIGRVTRLFRPSEAAGSEWVTAAERLRNLHSFEGAALIDMPADWLHHGRINLHAKVRVPMQWNYFGLFECMFMAPCKRDNQFTLEGIPIATPSDVVLAPIKLEMAAGETFASPTALLSGVRHVLPGGSLIKPGAYRAHFVYRPNSVAAAKPRDDGRFTCLDKYTVAGPQDSANRTCWQLRIDTDVLSWEMLNEPVANPFTPVPLRDRTRDYDLVVAIGDTPAGGYAQGIGAIRGVNRRDRSGTIVIRKTDRPFSSKAHEFGHFYGAPHAGQNCPDTRVGDDQEGERWPDDDRGRLQGMLFDRRVSDGTSTAMDGFGSTVLHDLMSYCGGAGDIGNGVGVDRANLWVSARNWQRWLHELVELRKRLAAQQSRSTTAAVGNPVGGAVGMLTSGGLKLSRVQLPQGASLNVQDDPTSAVRVISLAADGAVLRDSGARILKIADGQGSRFVASVHPGAASVQVVRAGVVRDSLVRTAAPVTSLTVTPAGTRVRPGDEMRLRWRAADEALAREDLTASVEYSPDNGRSWHTVWMGPDTGRATIPGNAVVPGAKARLRVRVSDGFAHGVATSGTFRVDGARPLVRILAPVRGHGLLAGRPVTLKAEVTDAWAQRLPGKRITWYAGSRRLGTGATLRTRLRGGKVRLRAVYVDDLGRRTSAVQRLRVAPNRIRITKLKYRDVLDVGTRKVRIRIAANGRARFVAGGRAWSIGRSATTIRVPLPRRPRRGVVGFDFTIVAVSGATGRLVGRLEVRRT